MSSKVYIGRFLIWRQAHISDRYFIIILSALIGFLSGMAAYFLKSVVFYIEDLLTAEFRIQSLNYWYAVYPAIGIFLTIILLKFLIRDKDTHGIPRILYVISRLDGKMKFRKVFSSLFGSSLTAGFGGSIGLESPIISSGASIGSSIAQGLRLNYRYTTLLIGCGAAGAIASIFTTPIAAVIFSLEVLMLDLTTASIIPLLMASVTGAITTKLLLAENMLVHFKVTQEFAVSDIPFFVLLGILAGLLSLYFNRMHFAIAKQAGKISNIWVRAAICGVALGLLIFIFPTLYGEGYDTISMIVSGNSAELLNNSFFYSYRDHAWVFIVLIVGMMLLKVIATTLTTEGGGIGGIFAPSAVTGGFMGFAFARFVNDLKLFAPLHEGNFTLVGMAGVLGGVLHAPLTAIFLIAEMTSGYELIVPLMLATAISFFTIKTFDPHSIFTRQLALRGDLISKDKDQTVLTVLNIKSVIDRDITTIGKDGTLGDLTHVIAKSKRNMFPVVDKKQRFLGVIDMNDIRADMFDPAKYDTPLQHYIIQPLDHVSSTDSMKAVMHKFNKTGYYNLPVIDNGKYVGFVSRAHVLNAYRQTLKDVSQEE
ncbi:MAG: chloride channel protein [Bacteroidota bacterium]